MDIDPFKHTNDKYGHVVGDEVLREVALRLSGAIRTEDQVARLGGDEFSVLLPLTKIDTAALIAERLRACLKNLYLKGVHSDLRITASIGIAALESGMSEDDLYEKADKALYEAKQLGRNRSTVAQTNRAY